MIRLGDLAVGILDGKEPRAKGAAASARPAELYTLGACLSLDATS
jgi:hypothetical protein